MKNILTISQDEFAKCIYQVSTAQLKNLIEGLFEQIQQMAARGYSQDVILDLERKQTKIMKELQRRGVLNDSTNVDFHNWLFNKHHKRVY